MAKILVADDEPDLREALARVCRGDGHEVLLASQGRETVDLARSARPDLIVLDNRMPVLSGLDALAEIREFDERVAVVLYTAYDDAADVRRAILELRAADYMTKDSGVDAIRATIHDALRSRGFAPTPEASPKAPVVAEPTGFAQLVGGSPVMLQLYDLIGRIAHSDVTVLVQGESGTGKELVARAIHDTSRRQDGAYVTVDCGTLPDTLTESEIFGYEAGAFTDARRSKPGKLELADGGTFFLDEIGNLSPSAQAKLLRVLEDRRVTRLGGSQTKTVDVRVIAATNLDLEIASREKIFREDLYYRLNVFKLQLPALRERKEDVPLLVEHFLSRFRIEQRKPLSGGLCPDALDLLCANDWPGNVRELRNVLERAVLLADDAVGVEHLPSDLGRSELRSAAIGVLPPSAAADALSPAARAPMEAEGAPSLPRVDLDQVPLKEAKRAAGDAVERAYILAALRRTGWNKSQAARLLGLNYKTLREKVRDLDLEKLRYTE
jgi:DNA-binding NtrC family response regulator